GRPVRRSDRRTEKSPSRAAFRARSSSCSATASRARPSPAAAGGPPLPLPASLVATFAGAAFTVAPFPFRPTLAREVGFVAIRHYLHARGLFAQTPVRRAHTSDNR